MNIEERMDAVKVAHKMKDGIFIVVEYEKAVRIAKEYAKEYAKERDKILKEVFDVLQEAPELNMCNYDHDQVRVLNDKMVEAFTIIFQSGLLKMKQKFAVTSTHVYTDVVEPVKKKRWKPEERNK